MIRAALAGLAMLVFAATAMAGQTDKRLDILFPALKAAKTPDSARKIEGEIWRIWLESDDPKVSALMTQGAQYMDLNDPTSALQVFDEVVKRAPNFAEGWNKRATVRYVLGMYDESAEDIERTLALEPRHFGALSGLGLVRLAQGRDKEALAAFERALAIDPFLEGYDSNIPELRDKLRGRPI